MAGGLPRLCECQHLHLRPFECLRNACSATNEEDLLSTGYLFCCLSTNTEPLISFPLFGKFSVTVWESCQCWHWWKWVCTWCTQWGFESYAFCRSDWSVFWPGSMVNIWFCVGKLFRKVYFVLCVCVPPPVVLLMKLKLSTFSGNTEVCPLIPLTYNIAGAVTTAMAVYLYTRRHMCAVLRESEHQRWWHQDVSGSLKSAPHLRWTSVVFMPPKACPLTFALPWLCTVRTRTKSLRRVKMRRMTGGGWAMSSWGRWPVCRAATPPSWP